MVRSIRDYRERVGFDVGLKPAGGIRSAKDTLVWLSMMRDELGLPWTRSGLFRFGASSLLRDLERQLEHLATGRYSAGYRHPLA
jgi:deoxyribose-phosphate aldolase